jgi:hypothetical protein
MIKTKSQPPDCDFKTGSGFWFLSLLALANRLFKSFSGKINTSYKKNHGRKPL